MNHEEVVRRLREWGDEQGIWGSDVFESDMEIAHYFADLIERWAADGHEGLAGASSDAPRDGSSDRLYRPGDFDDLRPGSGDQGDLDGRDQGVVELGPIKDDLSKTVWWGWA